MSLDYEVLEDINCQNLYMKVDLVLHIFPIHTYKPINKKKAQNYVPKRQAYRTFFNLYH